MRTVSFEGYVIACSPFPPSSYDTIQNMSEWRIQLFLVLAQKLIRWSAINESSALKISAQKQQVLFWWLSARISFRRMPWKKLFLHHFFTVYLSCCFQGRYIFAIPIKISLHLGKSQDWKNLSLYALSGDLAKILKGFPRPKCNCSSGSWDGLPTWCWKGSEHNCGGGCSGREMQIGFRACSPSALLSWVIKCQKM